MALSADEPFMRWRYFTWLLVMQGRLALMDGAALDLARSTKAPKKIVRSCALRGSALLALGERDTARAAMAHALKVAVDLGSPRMTLSIHIALAELEVAVGRPDEARLQYGAAGAVVDQIAAHLTDVPLREGFLASAPVRATRAHQASRPSGVN